MLRRMRNEEQFVAAQMVEGAAPNEHEVKHERGGIEISAGVYSHADGAFRTDVLWRPNNRASICPCFERSWRARGCVRQDADDSEIEHLEKVPTVGLQAQEQIIRLDVAVYDAERVRIFERSKELAGQVERFEDWKLLALVQLVLERAAAQVFGYKKWPPVPELPVALDGNNVRAIEELRERFGLEAQPVEDRAMVYEFDPRHFRNKPPPDAAVCDQKDITHATAAERPLQPVGRPLKNVVTGEVGV